VVAGRLALSPDRGERVVSPHYCPSAPVRPDFVKRRVENAEAEGPKPSPTLARSARNERCLGHPVQESLRHSFLRLEPLACGLKASPCER
jgi:hypothetical protein